MLTKIRLPETKALKSDELTRMISMPDRDRPAAFRSGAAYSVTSCSISASRTIGRLPLEDGAASASGPAKATQEAAKSERLARASELRRRNMSKGTSGFSFDRGCIRPDEAVKPSSRRPSLVTSRWRKDGITLGRSRLRAQERHYGYTWLQAFGPGPCRTVSGNGGHGRGE